MKKQTLFIRLINISIIVFVLLAAMGMRTAQAGSQVKLVGPAGSGYFGSSVVALSNGNIVVADPYYDDGAVQDVGAVYLYNGATRELISTLKGSTAFDRVGYIVSALPSGNFLVRSIWWNNSGNSGAGAVTWVNGTTGLNAVVSAANSLVGSSTDDYIGNGLTILSNGNYVLYSGSWDNGGVTNVGAVTWGDGNTGISGVVSNANSLVGSVISDAVGGSVVALTNGNYVVISTYWNNGGNTDVGAVTWGDGTTGITGPVTTANSLYGSTSNDQIGNFGVVALTNGNYVVQSPYWFNTTLMRTNAGAVTWGNGATGTTGAVSPGNSLIGNQVGSSIGSEVTALSNGNYVVGSWLWDNGVATNAGAITWSNGTTGTTGIVSVANSLVGTHIDDYIGSGIVALANGNYVAISTSWDDGAKNDVGAVTWGDGTTATSGTISMANSLIGFTADDQVGFVTALSNGNYLVSSTKWDNGPIVNAGAATFANGSTGISGYVSAANSLVGTTDNDYVGYNTQALTNGNYVVGSFTWDNGAVQDAGAVTWGNGTTGTIGTVSTSNSLVGSTAFDYLGNFYEIIPLPDGNYVVGSPYWDNGSIVDAGAVTWLNGTTTTSGIISPSNSLVGSTTLDKVGMVDGFFGDHQIKPLSNGNFIVISPEWKSTPWNLQGAVTYGTSSRTGVITSANSVLAGYGEAISLSNSVDYDAVNDQMVVGLPGGNKVVFFRTTGTFADVPSGYWAEDYIERLYNAGITGGCGVNPLIYCPTNPVTRAQMAVFLEKGIHGASFSPANVAATFGDTAGHWAEDWIEALKADGVTSGCGTGIYCPENAVTRDQMAVFLLKAKHGSAYIPPAVGASTGFSDVASDHWAAAWIKQLAAEAITGGCGSGNYCPENAVTRDQMAVFLVKAFGLP